MQGAHQGGRFVGARAGRPLRLLHRATSTGGQHPLLCPHAARRRRRGGPARRQRARPRASAYFRLGGVAHSARPPAARLGASTTRARSSTRIRVRDLATGHGPRRRASPTPRGGVVWAADSRRLFYIRLDDNHRPSQRLPPRARHAAARTTCWSTRRRTPASSSASARRSRDQLHRHRRHDHETSRSPADRRRRPERRAAAGRAARDRPSNTTSTKRGDGFFILTNADGAEDFKIVDRAGRRPGPRQLARARAARAGPADPRRSSPSRTTWSGSSARTACRASSCADSRDGDEHAIAFDEEAYSLGLSAATNSTPTTLRFTYSSMTTPAQVFDYDMATARARAAQDAGGAVRPRPGRLRDAPPAWRRRHDGETVPVSLLYRKRHAARRLRAAACSTATAPTASPSRPRSRHQLPVAGRPRLRLRHRPCPRRQGQGLSLVRRTASGEKKINTFTDFIAAGRASGRARATPRAAASSPRAARPAAC